MGGLLTLNRVKGKQRHKANLSILAGKMKNHRDLNLDLISPIINKEISKSIKDRFNSLNNL